MLGRMHHAGMNTYFKDLRKKIVAAKERGMPTAEVARAFGRGPLFGQALRQDAAPRRHANARRGMAEPQEQQPGQTSKGGRERQETLGGRPRGERPAATLTQRWEYLRSAVGLR